MRETQARLGEKVAEVQDQLKQVEREGQTQVDTLKENYEREALAENSRQETSLEAEKIKGYEQLRDLQRSQAAEISRVKREGEAELSKLDGYYRNTLYNSERNGEERLRDLENQAQRQYEFEKGSGTLTADQIRKEQKMEVQRIQDEKDASVTRAQESAHQEYEKKFAATSDAIQKSSENLEQRYRDTVRSHQQILGKVTNETTQELKQARLDSSRKLAAYNERQEDPFYQMLDMRAELTDQGDRYVLTAEIPEHEQHHVSVAVHGNQLVVSGSRRSEEKVELEPGHSRGTNAFQSFMESFPFAHPVEANLLQREFDGNRLVVTIPKKTLVSGYQPFKAKPKPLEVEKPHFPENLPHVKDNEETIATNPNPPKGFRPLT